MGRIKTKRVKSAGNALFAKYGESFAPDFDKNKEVLPRFAEVRSKKIRNVLAGYLAKKTKRRA